MSQNLMLDRSNGDYVLNEKGKIEETDSLIIPAYIRLRTKKGKWMYAPDTSYGSTFFEAKKRKTNGDASAMEKIASTALKPLIDDGRADQIDIDATYSSRHAIGLEIKIESSKGLVDTLGLESLGV